MMQYSREKKEDSVKLLKDTIETKIDKLTEINRNLKKELSDLKAIFEIDQQFGSNLELDYLLDNILLTCVKRLEVRGGFIAVQKTPDDKSFSLTRAYGIELKKGWGFSPDSSLVEYIKEKNKPLLIKNIIKEFKSDLKELQAVNLEIIAPLLIRDNMRGFLLLSGKIANQPYSEDDLTFLSILANQVAAAVDNLLVNQNEKDKKLKLKKAQPHLMQTEKLALLGQLTVAIAQQINNPLGIINNYLTILSRSLKKNDKSLDHLKVIKEEVDRIASLVKQLARFYRPGLEAKVPVVIESLFEDTLSFVEEEFARDKICIKRKYLPDLPRIKAYPEELRQVLLNLLMNSKESMPEGGEIEISSRVQDRKLEIEFKDTGRWAGEKNISPNFELFNLTENKGSELGLWVSSEIIKRYNGVIKVKNREDRKGICFKLSFPLEIY